MVVVHLLKNQQWWKGSKLWGTFKGRTNEGQRNESGRAEAHLVDLESTVGFVYFE